MNWKNIVFFAWSQELQDESLKLQLEKDLESFLLKNKEKISKIIYGNGEKWVMWMLLETAEKFWLEVMWYDIEKHINESTRNSKKVKVFKNERERQDNLFKDWDLFVALNWALWTIEEILVIKSMIKCSDLDKKIFVPKYFKEFYELYEKLSRSWNIYPEDKKIIKIIDSLEDIKL